MSHQHADDLESNRFLQSLQSVESKLHKYYSLVSSAAASTSSSANGLLLLIPPNHLLPKSLDDNFAKQYIFKPVAQPQQNVTLKQHESTNEVTSAASDSDSSSTVAAASSPSSLWTNLLNQSFQITNGLIYAAPSATSSAATAAFSSPSSPPLARILFEELHYNDNFDSFKVLCLDKLLQYNSGSQSKQESQRKGSINNGTQQQQSLANNRSQQRKEFRPDQRTLNGHRDLITRLLGEVIATRCIFASPRLDFFFTDFQLAWLNACTKDPAKAAAHIQQAAVRAMQEALTALKESKSSSSSSSSSSRGVTNHNVASWPKHLLAELEIAIQTHIASCLHSKIFSLLCKHPKFKLASEAFQKTITDLHPISLFDVGVSPHLVGLVDPRPAIEHMKQMSELHTPIERIAVLQQVELLIMESIKHSISQKEQQNSDTAITRPETPASPSNATSSRNNHNYPPLTPSKPISTNSNATSSNPSPSLRGSASPAASSYSPDLHPLHPLLASASASATPRSRTISGADQLNVPSIAPTSSSSTPQDHPPPTFTHSFTLPTTPHTFDLSRISTMSDGMTAPAAETRGDGAASPLPVTYSVTTTLAPTPVSASNGSNPSNQTHLGRPSSFSPAVELAVDAPPTPLVASDSGQSTASASTQPSSPTPRVDPAPDPVSVSADDLLPLLVYVLLESKPMNVHANIQYMRHFIPASLAPSIHSQLLYRLANFEAAIQFIESGQLAIQMRASAAAMKKRTRMASISIQSRTLRAPPSSSQQHRDLFRRRAASTRTSRAGSSTIIPPLAALTTTDSTASTRKNSIDQQQQQQPPYSQSFSNNFPMSPPISSGIDSRSIDFMPSIVGSTNNDAGFLDCDEDGGDEDGFQNGGSHEDEEDDHDDADDLDVTFEAPTLPSSLTDEVDFASTFSRTADRLKLSHSAQSINMYEDDEMSQPVLPSVKNSTLTASASSHFFADQPDATPRVVLPAWLTGGSEESPPPTTKLNEFKIVSNGNSSSSSSSSLSSLVAPTPTASSTRKHEFPPLTPSASSLHIVNSDDPLGALLMSSRGKKKT